MWSPQTARQQPHDAIAQKGAAMNRSSPDYLRRPRFCPRCAAEPLADVPDIYLELMFGEPPTGDAQHVEADRDKLVA